MNNLNITCNPTRVDVIDNPNLKYTAEQIRTMGGYDIVINALLFDWGTLKSCCDVKINGVVSNDDQYTYFGYGWKNGELPHVAHTNDMPNLDNFISCIWAIHQGTKQPLDNNAVGIGGIRGRTAFGFKADGKMVIICTSDTNGAMSLTQARDKLYDQGCVSGIILDGGGSSQIDSVYGDIFSSRKVRTYIGIKLTPKSQDQLFKYNVIETNWKWNGTLTKRNLTTDLILHHCAGYGAAESIHNYHRSLGWLGIAYHYYVRMDGTIYRGRPEWSCGGHTLNYNYKALGICAEGNFNVDQMPQVQKDAIKWLVSDIKSRYPSISVKRHCDVNQTACPCKNYPFDYIIENSTNVPIETPTTLTTDTNYVKVFQTWLNTNYASKLTTDGVYGDNTKIAAVKAYQTYLNKTYNAGLVADGVFGTKTKNVVRAIIRGQKDNSVYILQGLLFCNKYDCKGLDGVFGTDTYNAVNEYQADYKLIADGIAGKNTIEFLMK